MCIRVIYFEFHSIKLERNFSHQQTSNVIVEKFLSTDLTARSFDIEIVG